MSIFAVTSDGRGLKANLNLIVEPGTGKIWSAVEPLVGTSTQTAERTAIYVAGNYSTEVNNHDYKFTIQSNASVVEGPSAGAAMSLLVISLLKGRKFPGNVSITGTIDKDGFIGPVGGIYEKTLEASKTGMDLFIIPKGEAHQTAKIDGTLKNINLLEYAPENWGIKVVEAATIDDAFKYAFMDIEDIAVDITSEESTPKFLPDPIPYPSNLEPMKQLTNNYVEEAKHEVSAAKNAVSTTLIEDASLIAVLLEILNDSEHTLNEAELLNDQNYLYSAANFTFLARVNAAIVKDISDNPSLLEPNSTALELKVKNLRNDIKDLRLTLSDYIPLDYLEYHISAKQRLSYAERTVNKILSTQTVVVGETSTTVAIDQIRDYQFAVAWYNIAEDFHSITEESVLRARPDDTFREYAQEAIVEAENSLAIAGEEAESDDIKRRIEAAKIELNNGWYMASLFDSHSALALAKSELVAKDQDLNSLYPLLREKVAELDANMSASKHQFVWSTLYHAHSMYYLESADFYYAQNIGAATVGSLKNGVSLAYLTEYTYQTANDILNYYDTFGPEDYLPVERGEQQAPYPPQQRVTPMQSLLVFAVVFVLSAIIVIVLVRRTIFVKGYRRHYSVEAEIKHVKTLMEKIDQSLEKERISQKKHDELKAIYRQELLELEMMRETKTHDLIELDGMKADLNAFRQRLHDLSKHYKQGVILKKDYDMLCESYKQGIEDLQRRIASKNLRMSKSKDKLAKIGTDIENNSGF